jgi:hypothetical protein
MLVCIRDGGIFVPRSQRSKAGPKGTENYEPSPISGLSACAGAMKESKTSYELMNCTDDRRASRAVLYSSRMYLLWE